MSNRQMARENTPTRVMGSVLCLLALSCPAVAQEKPGISPQGKGSSEACSRYVPAAGPRTIYHVMRSEAMAAFLLDIAAPKDLVERFGPPRSRTSTEIPKDPDHRDEADDTLVQTMWSWPGLQIVTYSVPNDTGLWLVRGELFGDGPAFPYALRAGQPMDTWVELFGKLTCANAQPAVEVSGIGAWDQLKASVTFDPPKSGKGNPAIGSGAAVAMIKAGDRYNRGTIVLSPDGAGIVRRIEWYPRMDASCHPNAGFTPCYSKLTPPWWTCRYSEYISEQRRTPKQEQRLVDFGEKLRSTRSGDGEISDSSIDLPYGVRIGRPVDEWARKLGRPSCNPQDRRPSGMHPLGYHTVDALFGMDLFVDESGVVKRMVWREESGH
jgi:hypothetical protein